MSIAAALLSPGSSPQELLEAVLDVSLTGINLLSPRYSPSGELEDFALDYLNPAARRMTGLTERPSGTARAHFPDIFTNGIFDFYRCVFETGQPGQRDFNYQADGLDNYFHLAARRSGELLVVSFTDTSNQDRSPVEMALRESQAAEKAARAEAEVQRQRLHDILMQMPAQVAINRGPDHVFDLVNPPYQQLFPSRSIQGKPVRQALPELEGQQFYELLDQVYQTGEPFYGQEMPAQVDYTNTGRMELRYFDVYFQALRNAQGSVEGILNFAYDITGQVLARRQVEDLNLELEGRVQERTSRALALQADLLAAARRQAAERETFYQIFEQTPAGIVLLRGPDHRVEYHNEAYQQLFPGRQMRGNTIAEMLPDAAGQGFVALLDGVYRTGETFFGRELRLDIEQPGGMRRETYFNFTYHAFRENDQIAGISVFAYDVTEQVLARWEREAQQRQMREVFEQAPVAIFVLRGAEYVLEVVNPAMGEMLGAEPGRILGRRYMEEFPGLARQGYRDLLDGVWHSGRGHVAHEQPAQLPHHGPGETGYYNFSYVPLREYVPLGEPQGHVTGIMCVAVEVTAQVLARQKVQQLNQELGAINEELAAANEELRAANEKTQASNEELSQSNGQLLRTNADLDNFIYTASHDLKSPISNIEGLLAALLRNLSPESLASERVQAITARMQDSVERFKKTIASLTEIVRLQKDNNQQETEVNLSEVIREVLLDLEPVIRSTGAQVEVHVTSCPAIRFSEKNLRSVIYNLLSNAVKYRSPDRLPRVQIECQSTSEYHVLTVTDNGLGMKESQLEKLFTMFKRFHTHVEGSGIGLYMIRKMVENAGGRIQVASKAGEGTVFTVYFLRHRN